MSTYPFGRALVTGASAGIGESFARLLATAGVGVVVVARRQDRLVALASEFANIEVLQADLQTQDGIDAVIRRLNDTNNPIDLLVNNAGFGTTGVFDGIDPERTTQEIALNVNALVRLTHAAINVFLPRQHGYVLNVSSVGAFQAGPTLAVYAATKAFVTSFTEAVHEENRKRGVHVTALHPGFVPTEFQAVSSAKDTTSNIPKFMWLKPERVAHAGLVAVARNKAISVPAVLYKTLVIITKIFPRGAVRRIAGSIIAD